MNHIGVLTSGGDSPGMNAAIRAVARTAGYHGLQCTGIRHGYQGLIDNDLIPLGPRDVGGIINRGGTILKSARCKAFMEPDGRRIAAATLRHHGIDGLVVIGGDGSYHGAKVLHDEHGIAVIGVPGTIDNDIGGTDFTLGFDTAMNTAMRAIDMIRDTAESFDRIFFVEVMGRHSGYLAMIAGMASGAEEILIPEESTNIPEIIERMRAAKALGKTSMIIVVAEGDDVGNAFQIAAMINEQSEFKDSRVTVLGHLQRGGSPTALDRILASRMGVRAVEALMAGESGKMVGYRDDQIVLAPLEEAWQNKNLFDIDLLRVAKILST